MLTAGELVVLAGKHSAIVEERTLGEAAGAAWKNVDARKSTMAAPVSFSRWFGGADFRLARFMIQTDPVCGARSSAIREPDLGYRK
jgi:hypothetical protein